MLHSTRNIRRIQAKADKLPDTVVTDSRTTTTGSYKLWYYHAPCDDGDSRHGKSDGFIRVAKPDPDKDDSPEHFVFKCSGCGETWDYFTL